MIVKGNQRGGGRQLATHLLNQFDNSRVEVLDLRGAAADDLHGAFYEWYVQSKGTRCEKYLYSLSINPDHEKYDLTREQNIDLIKRIERSLKLVNQPRAIVLHNKKGREHFHVAWSRIDAAEMKAVHMAKDRMALRRVVQEFARDHGLELPPGMRKDGRSERFNEKARRSDLAEKQQQERSGVPKDERRAVITEAWNAYPGDARLFVMALEQRGYILACGRDTATTGKPKPPRYVVVDRAGAAHALARQIEGANTKDIRAFLGRDFPLARLPDVETARALQLERLAKLRDERPDQPKEPDIRAADLASKQEERRAPLLDELTQTDARHETERRALSDLHASEDRGILSARAFKQPAGLRAFVLRITGFKMLIGMKHKREDAARAASQKQQAEALKDRHSRELADIDRRLSALDSIEARENLSLATVLKREAFLRTIASPVRQPGHVRGAPNLVSKHDAGKVIHARLEPPQQETSVPRPARQPQPQPPAMIFRPEPPIVLLPAKPPEVRPDFTRATAPPEKQTGTGSGSHSWREIFNKIAEKVKPPAPTPAPPPPVREEFRKAAEPPTPEPQKETGDTALDRARRLAEEIRRREQQRPRDPGRDRGH